MRVGGHRPEPGASFGQEVTGARVAARGGAGPTGHTRLWRRMMTRVALLPAAATLLMFGLTLTGCARSSFPVSQVAENSAGVLLVDLLERAHSATVRLSHAGEHFDGGGGEATNGWSSPHHVAGTDLSFAWADSTGHSSPRPARLGRAQASHQVPSCTDRRRRDADHDGHGRRTSSWASSTWTRADSKFTPSTCPPVQSRVRASTYHSPSPTRRPPLCTGGCPNSFLWPAMHGRTSPPPATT